MIYWNDSVTINKTTSFDPLEQFTIYQISSEQVQYHYLNVEQGRCPYNFIRMWRNISYHADFAFGLFYDTISNMGLYYINSTTYVIILVVILITALLWWSLFFGQKLELYNKKVPVWNFGKFLTRAFFFLIKGIVRSNTRLKRKEYFSALLFLFIFIFASNLFGLIPYTTTITSSFIVTFFLSSTHFIGINIIGIYRQRWHFLNLILPSGVPIIISPFLVIIELISYVAKVLSLSIRLFANMMSGHALLKILIGFSWTMLSIGCDFLYGAGFLVWVIVTLIMFLELLIAFLQAYVFVVLVAIYIHDATSSSH